MALRVNKHIMDFSCTFSPQMSRLKRTRSKQSLNSNTANQADKFDLNIADRVKGRRKPSEPVDSSSSFATAVRPRRRGQQQQRQRQQKQPQNSQLPKITRRKPGKAARHAEDKEIADADGNTAVVSPAEVNEVLPSDPNNEDAEEIIATTTPTEDTVTVSELHMAQSSATSTDRAEPEIIAPTSPQVQTDTMESTSATSAIQVTNATEAETIVNPFIESKTAPIEQQQSPAPPAGPEEETNHQFIAGRFNSYTDAPFIEWLDPDRVNFQVQPQTCATYLKNQRFYFCANCTGSRSCGGGCLFIGYRLVFNNRRPPFSFPTERHYSSPKMTGVAGWHPPELNRHPSDAKPRPKAELRQIFFRSAHVHLNRLFADELAFIDEYTSGNRRLYFRPLPAGQRQACDWCSTSILNAFWICNGCGREICVDCHREWPADELRCCLQKVAHYRCQEEQAEAVAKESAPWIRYFVPAHRIPVTVVRSLAAKFQEISMIHRYTPRQPRWDWNSVPSVNGTHLLPVMDIHHSQMSAATLKNCLERGQPIVVRQLLDILRDQGRSEWTPQTLLDLYASEPALILDCADADLQPVEGVDVRQFLQGMLDGSQRPRRQGVNGDPMDWPPNSDFDKHFPELYEDFMSILPLRSYTSKNGSYNIIRFMPDDYVPPDLGPKMYNAYATDDDGPRGYGTTNLHSDMADAVNIMMFAGKRPADLIDHGPDIGGALWNIYPSEHGNLLREFLQKLATDEGLIIEDPIHDQCFYLTATLRQRLFEQHGVRSFEISQNPGDAIFIPAGCPHQVCNFKPCIKVAMDFVCPERIDQCLQLASEFRHLSKNHCRQQDILQAKNLLFQTFWQLFAKGVGSGGGSGNDQDDVKHLHYFRSFSSGAWRKSDGSFGRTKEQEEAYQWSRTFMRNSIPVDKFTISYMRSSGPGGQNVNKVSSKVEMRFPIRDANWIPVYLRQQLLQQLGSAHVTKGGEFVISSQSHRTQPENQQACVSRIHDILNDLVNQTVPGDTDASKTERVQKLVKSEQRRKMNDKIHLSKLKSNRRTKPDF